MSYSFKVDPDVMEKIKKLLALGKSDNVHEAALAMARAQALMDRHRISQAMLDLSGDPGQAEQPEMHGDPLFAGKMSSWNTRLAMVIARANGCYLYRQKITKTSLMLVGTASNVARARYLFAYCFQEVKRLCNLEARGRDFFYRNNFRLGCVDAIAEAIEREQQAIREEMMKGAATVNERALVVQATALVAQDAETARALAHRQLRFSKGRPMKAGTYDASGRAHGQRAGASIYPGSSSGRIADRSRQLGPGSKS